MTSSKSSTSKSRRKNRYAGLYGALRYLAVKKGYGGDHLGLLMAKRKIKRKFKIKSFKDLSTKELKLLSADCYNLANETEVRGVGS